MQNTAPEVHVACAIIWRNGKILLSRRHESVHQGGLWEFPGGKFEIGENPSSCLIRELLEELGIIPQSAAYICQIPWTYSDTCIRLWVYEVFEYKNNPIGREGQDIEWFDPKDLKAIQFPKANDAIIRAIGLPRISRFYDTRFMIEPVIWASRFHEQSLLYFRGVPAGPSLRIAVDRSLELGHQIVLTLNQLSCYQVGCGVHLRKNDLIIDAMNALTELQLPWPITSGIRNTHDIERQAKWPSDAIFISPVRETKSHQGSVALGFKRFAELASKVGVPVYALGGMHHQDLDQVMKYCGFGVAGIRGFQ